MKTLFNALFKSTNNFEIKNINNIVYDMPYNDICIFLLPNESMNEFLSHFYAKFHIDIEAKRKQTFSQMNLFMFIKMNFDV